MAPIRRAARLECGNQAVRLLICCFYYTPRAPHLFRSTICVNSPVEDEDYEEESEGLISFVPR